MSFPSLTGASLCAFAMHSSRAAMRELFADPVPIETTETIQAKPTVLRQIFMINPPLKPRMNRAANQSDNLTPEYLNIELFSHSTHIF
jgi:hypothetical protein